MNENKYFKILTSVREKLKEASDEAHKNNNFDTCDTLDEIRYWLDKELGLLTEEDTHDLKQHHVEEVI